MGLQDSIPPFNDGIVTVRYLNQAIYKPIGNAVEHGFEIVKVFSSFEPVDRLVSVVLSSLKDLLGSKGVKDLRERFKAVTIVRYMG
jgi:hypothetical protein